LSQVTTRVHVPKMCPKMCPGHSERSILPPSPCRRPRRCSPGPRGCSQLAAGDALLPAPRPVLSEAEGSAAVLSLSWAGTSPPISTCIPVPARSALRGPKAFAAQGMWRSLSRGQLPAAVEEPNPDRVAKMSPALWLRPAFPQHRLPLIASSVSGSLSLRIPHGGPLISLINKVRKTGPLRKS